MAHATDVVRGDLEAGGGTLFGTIQPTDEINGWNDDRIAR